MEELDSTCQTATHHSPDLSLSSSSQNSSQNVFRRRFLSFVVLAVWCFVVHRFCQERREVNASIWFTICVCSGYLLVEAMYEPQNPERIRQRCLQVATAILMLLSLVASKAAKHNEHSHLDLYLHVGIVLVLTPYFFDSQYAPTLLHELEHKTYHLGCSLLLLCMSASFSPSRPMDLDLLDA
jgi:D-alanyl-lipoteichoic acid acyltransferase DltB (MBOAT superfamily)